MTVGIPRSIFYYYFKDKWKYFLEKLNINYIISPITNKKILENGIKYSNDEMCLSLKNYIGHINYLKDKCDYILIPRIDNYGIYNQTCTNFLGIYDIINNLFDVKILNYNIDIENKQTEIKGLLKLTKIFNKTRKQIKDAYEYAEIKSIKKHKNEVLLNMSKLYSSKTKVLIIGHPYNIYDELIGKRVIDYLKKLGCEVILSNLFDNKNIDKETKKYSESLYWKYSKENIYSLKYQDKVDGIIFLSTFPCGLDSLVNELVFKKIKKPYLNLIIDDLGGNAGIETRLESFIDIFEYN